MLERNQEHLTITNTNHPDTAGPISFHLEVITKHIGLRDSFPLPNSAISINTPDLTVKTIGNVFQLLREG
jgi:hypothetical protein